MPFFKVDTEDPFQAFIFFSLSFSALFSFVQYGNIQNTEHNSDCCFA